jgi:hypothetical protein
LTIETNMCDVYITTEKREAVHDGHSLDSYINAQFRPKDEMGLMSVQVTRGFYRVSYDPATNTLSLVKRFEERTGLEGADERRGVRCKVVAWWAGSVTVTLVAGPGKLHFFNHRFYGRFFDPGSAIRVKADMASPESFVLVSLHNAEVADIEVSAPRGVVHLRNNTASRMNVTLGRGVIEVQSRQALRLKTSAGLQACLSAGGILPASAAEYALFNTTAPLNATSLVLPSTSLTVVGLAEDNLDVAVTVWAPDGIRKDGRLDFVSAVVGATEAAAENATAGSNSTTSLSAEAAAVLAASPLQPVVFRDSDLAKLRAVRATAEGNSVILMYTHITGAGVVRPVIRATSWVSAKLTSPFLGLASLFILDPPLTILHINAVKGFCPAMPRANTTCVPSGVMPDQHLCSADAVDLSFNEGLLRTYRAMVASDPDLVSGPRGGIFGWRVRDDWCLTRDTEVDRSLCLRDLPVGHVTFFKNNFTGSTNFSATALDRGAQPGILAMIILSMIVAIIIPTGLLIWMVRESVTRAKFFRTDRLIQDDRATALVEELVRSVKDLCEFSKRNGEPKLTIGEVVGFKFMGKLHDAVQTHKGASDPAKAQLAQLAAELLRKLRLLHLASSLMFLPEFTGDSWPVDKGHFSVEEAIERARSHNKRGALKVALTSLLLTILPALVFYYPSTVINTSTLNHQDQWEGSESHYLTASLVTWAFSTHVAIIFGLLATASLSTAKVEPNDPSLTDDPAWKKVKFWARNTVTGIASFFLCCSAWVSMGFTLLVSEWTLLGLFVNAERAAPYASGVIGIIGHIASLRKTTLNSYKKVQRHLRDGIMAYHVAKDKARRQVAMLLGTQASWGPDPEGEPGSDENEEYGLLVEDPLAPVITDEQMDFELRRYMTLKGLTISNLAIALVTTTTIILAVLGFLYLGYVSLVPESSPSSAIICSGLAFGCVVGLSRTQATDDADAVLMQIADELLEQYKRDHESEHERYTADERAIEVFRRSRRWREKEKETEKRREREKIAAAQALAASSSPSLASPRKPALTRKRRPAALPPLTDF